MEEQEEVPQTEALLVGQVELEQEVLEPLLLAQGLSSAAAAAAAVKSQIP